MRSGDAGDANDGQIHSSRRNPLADAPTRLATITNLDDHRAGGTATPARVTYTIPEVCALLGISRATAYAMLRAGEIPAMRLGSRWIIPRHRFACWLNSDPIASIPNR